VLGRGWLRGRLSVVFKKKATRSTSESKAFGEDLQLRAQLLAAEVSQLERKVFTLSCRAPISAPVASRSPAGNRRGISCTIPGRRLWEKTIPFLLLR
jgi:hypothetical protein